MDGTVQCHLNVFADVSFLKCVPFSYLFEICLTPFFNLGHPFTNKGCGNGGEIVIQVR